jgi:hypothetical protein
MSSQSLNASNYSGYIGVQGLPNPSGAIPTRDASDITRQVKERLIYLAGKDTTTISRTKNNVLFQRPQVNPAGVNHIPGNSEWSWLPYSNQYRLSYFYGKLQLGGTAACNTCPGGGGTGGTAYTGKGAVFDGNGPVLPGTTANGTSGS